MPVPDPVSTGLRTETFDLTTSTTREHNFSQIREMGEDIAEVLRGMLQEEDNVVSPTAGRLFYYSRETVELTVTDTPANLARVADFLNSLNRPARRSRASQLNLADKILKLEDELTFEDIRIRVTRINSAATRKPLRDCVEMYVRTSMNVEERVLEEGTTTTIDNYLVSILEIQPLPNSHGDGQVHVQLRRLPPEERQYALRVDSELRYGDLTLRLCQIEENDKDDPDDDAVHLFVRTPTTSKPIRIGEGTTHTVDGFVIINREIRTVGPGEGSASFEIKSTGAPVPPSTSSPSQFMGPCFPAPVVEEAGGTPLLL